MSLKKLFGLVPEWSLKKRIRCRYFNHFRSYNFYIDYINQRYQFKFENGIIVKFHEGIWRDLATLEGYLCNYKLQNGDVVIDCGAYVGAFAIYAAKIIGSNGKVIAFEPDTTNYRKLINNIKLNNLPNIIPINKGVWSKNTFLNFNSKQSDPECSSFFFDECEQIIEVPVVSIDNELKERGMKKVDFIKMDVEGAEIEAIKGSETTLKNNNVNLAIASYHIVNGQKTCFESEKLLSKFNYDAKTSNPEHLTTYATKKKQLL